MRLGRRSLVAAIVLVLLATSTLAAGLRRDALGTVVAACALSKSRLGLDFPCTDVRLDSPGSDGYAIIRSPGFASEFLLTPLADIEGIESTALLKPSATGLWQSAWAARSNVLAALGRTLPRNDIALAVNAHGTRTQDHFHIHVDCLRQSVGKVLSRQFPTLGEDWTRLPVRLRGETYWARAIASPDLAGINVAQLLAQSPPAGSTPMDHATIALVPRTLASGVDGFYLLANWTNASAEQLLDHRCRGV